MNVARSTRHIQHGTSAMKGISRVDIPARALHGWSVRVRAQGRTHAKWIADNTHGGRNKSLQAAVVARNALERELALPRTDRVLRHTNTVLKTGIRRTVKGGTPVYEITWSPQPGRVARTSVSIRKWGEREALARAERLRAERERELYGKALP